MDKHINLHTHTHTHTYVEPGHVAVVVVLGPA